MRIIRKRPTAELISCLNDERVFRFVEVSTVQGLFRGQGYRFIMIVIRTFSLSQMTKAKLV